MKKLLLFLIALSLFIPNPLEANASKPCHAKITSRQVLCVSIACAILGGIATKYCLIKEKDFEAQLEALVTCVEQTDCESLEEFRKKELKILSETLGWKTKKWLFGGVTLASIIAAIISGAQMWGDSPPSGPSTPIKPDPPDPTPPKETTVQTNTPPKKRLVHQRTRSTPPPSLGNRVPRTPPESGDESDEESEDESNKEDNATKPPKKKSQKKESRSARNRRKMAHKRINTLTGNINDLVANAHNYTPKEYDEKLEKLKSRRNEARARLRGINRRKPKKRELTDREKERTKRAKELSRTTSKVTWDNFNFTEYAEDHVGET